MIVNPLDFRLMELVIMGWPPEVWDDTFSEDNFDLSLPLYSLDFIEPSGVLDIL